MPTIGLSRLVTPGPSSSPLWSNTRRISPWRPEPRRRLAAGLAAMGSVVLLLGMGAPRARASSPDAWRAYDGEVLRACLKASRLLQPRALGERIDVPVADVSSSGITLLISAFLIAGRYPHAPMQGQMDRELCLFEQRTRRATVATADQLDRPRPQPGSPLTAKFSAPNQGSGLRVEETARQAHGKHHCGDAVGGEGDPLAGGAGFVDAALEQHEIGQGGGRAPQHHPNAYVSNTFQGRVHQLLGAAAGRVAET